MAVSAFDGAVALVLDLEGGFVHDPRDPGGASNHGITRATLAASRGKPVSVADVRSLTREEASAIYRRHYWEPIAADRLPAGLDLAVFDFAVNSGPSRAVRTLRAALALASGSRVDDATIDAASRREPADTIRDICRLRVEFLRALPTWRSFGRGWTNRIQRVERAALAAAGPIARRQPAPDTNSPGEKESTMNSTKTILASRTVWSNLIGLASVGLGIAGVKTGAIDANGLADAAVQIVTGVSFVASTVFRVVAKKQIGATPA